MTELVRFVASAAFIGAGATLLLDAWAFVLKRVLGVPAASYPLVGRWMLYFPRGRFVHEHITHTPAMPGEAIVGWAAHYVIGIAYAALLLAFTGIEWAREPSLWPALLCGWVTMIAPFFVMQPGMGAGVLASKTPNPAAARLRTMLSHTVFGAGLYVAARVLSVGMNG